jgi:hypothetical protein
VIQVVMFWAGQWGELQKWMAFGCHMWIFLHHFVLVGSVFQGENMGTK